MTVAAPRECAWTAGVEGAWLSIKSGANGQGDGSVEFMTAANADPQTRTGAVIVNGQRASVSQAAGVCEFSLPEASTTVPPAGGSKRVDVRASSPLCRWTAASESPWIEVTSGASGQGGNPVTIQVAPTTGPPRSGALTIAGQRYTVTQSQGCSYQVDPLSPSVPSSGGTAEVRVTTTAACSWSANSNVEWITVLDGASGSGPGIVRLLATATTGPTRSGTVTIAGTTVTVTQSAGCVFGIAPSSQSVAAGGGTMDVAVTAPAGCAWTASSATSWIAVSAGASGSGNGSVRLTASANTGPSRTGTATIAGRTFTVTQASGCAYTLTPPSIQMPAAGGPTRIEVATAAACSWTATSSSDWILMAPPASGSGNSRLDLAIVANTGPARNGSIAIEGRTVAITQESGCTIAINPSSQDVGKTGGTATVTVSAAGGCTWTATSSAPWIVVTSGASGTGNGTVQLTIDTNATGAARSASVAIGGQTFTVNQE